MDTTITVNDATLAYTRRGNGPPLVLLHGGLGTSSMWEPAIAVLAHRYHVIALDSRGHGRSTNPAGVLSYPLLADDVAAAIAALRLDQPVVVGWSDGGQVALELAVRHPHVAAALVIGGAYPEFTVSGLREVHHRLLDELHAEPDAELAELMGPHDDWNSLLEQTTGMWLDYAGLTDDAIAAIDRPVLVLTGDRDEIVGIDLALALYRQLPAGELAVIAQASHEAPATPARAAAFASAIADFADRHSHPTPADPRGNDACHG